MMFEKSFLNLSLLVSLLACFSANAANSEDGASSGGGKRIVKWVDSQGVTHYGDKLPTELTGRNNTVMNNQGIIVKRNVPTDNNAAQQDAEKLAQQRKDSILIASYTKAEEIDLARDRNLQMDQAAVQALTVQKDNLAGRTARNQKTADGFHQRQKPLPEYLNDELKLAKLESAKIDKQIAGRKLSMEATRKRFADEKIRFIALKQTSTPDASAMSPAPAEAPKPAPAANTGLSKTLSTQLAPVKTK